MSLQPELWAPTAETVELEIDSGRVPCVKDGQIWSAPVELADGTLYRFVVDGVVVPDPRSTCQPEGVHGPSRVEAHADEVHLDGPPIATTAVNAGLDRAVIYEIHLGTFDPAGDLAGAARHLDHLVSLGVTHIEIMPIAAFDGDRGWGYDGVSLFAPHPAYGTTEDLRRFVQDCHRHGLAVLLDVVYNHLGPSGNYLGVSGPYFTDRYSTPWGDAVNLDGPGSDGVRSFIIDNALYWLEDVGFDGLRLDAVHALFDHSAVPILEELAAEVAALGQRSDRTLVLIAESDLNDPRLAHPAPAGTGLDAVWADDVHHGLHVALTGEDQGYYEDYGPADLPTALTEGYIFQARYSPHRDRRVGRSTAGTPSQALVAALQNHDQIGNRATGDRIHHSVGEDRAAAAAALLLTSPFAVLLFQGEEWAASTPFPYFSDQPGDLGEAIRNGRRREFAAFGWTPDQVPDPQSRETFDNAILRWDELDQPAHAQQLEWYRSLIALRGTHPDCAPATLPIAGHRALIEGRTAVVQRGALTVIANLGDDPAEPVVATGQPFLQRGDISRDGDTWKLGPGATIVLDAS